MVVKCVITGVLSVRVIVAIILILNSQSVNRFIDQT